jgi:hypothetical protein
MREYGSPFAEMKWYQVPLFVAIVTCSVVAWTLVFASFVPVVLWNKIRRKE